MRPMRVTVSFTTENAAFQDYGFEAEVLKILERARRKIVEHGKNEILACINERLLDSNGNFVGSVIIEKEY